MMKMKWIEILKNQCFHDLVH